MTKRMRSVTSRAVEKLGLQSQLRVTQEECAELVAMINRHSRKRAMKRAVAEEAADVYITLEYVRILTGDRAVDSAIERKLTRLAKRLKKA